MGTGGAAVRVDGAVVGGEDVWAAEMGAEVLVGAGAAAAGVGAPGVGAIGVGAAVRRTGAGADAGTTVAVSVAPDTGAGAGDSGTLGVASPQAATAANNMEPSAPAQTLTTA